MNCVQREVSVHAVLPTWLSGQEENKKDLLRTQER